MKNMFNLRFSKTAILTAIAALALSQSARAQSIVTWTGNDIVTNNIYNWSDANNWSGGTPAGNIVLFPNQPFPASTNVIGAVNNIVDQTMGVASVIYNNTNGGTTTVTSNYVTTFFNPGVTLTCTGPIPLVVNGYPGGSDVITTVNMQGTNYAFIVTNYEGTVWIGGTNAQNVEQANFTLGDGTNIIDCGTFNFANSDGGNGRQSILSLGNGQNIISAQTMNIGVSKAMGNIQFNGPAGSLAMYGTNGPTSRVGTMTLGYGNSGTGGSIGQIAITNGQPISVLASTLIVGELGDDTGTGAHGIINYNNGTFDVTSLEMGLIASGAKVGATPGNLLTVGGSPVTSATLIVNSPSGPGGGSFYIGDCQISTAGDYETSTLNISSNGTADVYCNLLKYLASNNTNTININTNGTLILENATNTIGVATNPIDVINIEGTLGLALSGSGTAPLVFGTTITATNGVIAIESVSHVFAIQTVPLISYNAADGDPFSGLTLTVPSGYVGSLVDDGAGTISISIRSSSFVLVQLQWAGTAGTHAWDINTSVDWNNFNGSGLQTYTNPDEVNFDDTAANGNVTLNANVLPGTLSFTNNSLNYVFTGTGSIGGPALTLFKNGSASLTLSESGGDSFGSGIKVNGGTLVLDDLNNTIDGGIDIASGATGQIGNNDASGNLPTGGVSDNGSLVFDHSSGTTDTVAGAISGSGTVTLSGGGTVKLTGVNTYTGNTVVNAGTLALSGSGTVSNSANVAVSGATLDVSGESASALPEMLPNGSSLNNSTLTLAMPNTTPALYANILNLSGTITVNVTALPPIASYPTILAIVETGFSGLGGTFTLVTGSLPAGFSGSVSKSSNNSEILLTLSSGPTGVRPTTVWNATNGVSATVNWSTAANWFLPGAPTPEDNVFFVDNGTAVFGSPYTSGVGSGPTGVGTPGNNVVDTTFTVGTLTYTNVNMFQDTMIANGDSLNVISNGSLTVGSPSVDFGGGVTTTATIGGSNATLNVSNTNGTLFVGHGSGASSSSAFAALDLSGLGTFNASVGSVLVGVGSASQGIPLARMSGILYLAQTNDIVAALPAAGTETSDTATNAVTFDVGDDNGNNSSQTAALYLGQTNAIFADAISVGRQKQAATMGFNAFFTGNNTAYFRGNSTNEVGTWSIGDGVANSGTIAASGTCDFTAASSDGNGDASGGDGYVNALVGTMYVGRGSSSTSSSGAAIGVLTFDNGVIDVGTLFIGNQPAAAKDIVSGTVNVNNNTTLGTHGTLAAGALDLAVTATGAPTNAVGVLNISGGTVTIGSLVCGTNSSITLGFNGAGGTLAITNPVPAPGIGILALEGGTLQLSPVYGFTNVVASNVTVTAATTINIASLGTTVGGPLQVPLITYVGTDPGIANLSIGTIPTGFSAASLSDDGAGHIFLNITAPPVLSWVGAVGATLNSTWDIGVTHNWAAGSTFANGDLVLFADTAQNGAVDLTTALTPDSTSVSNNVLNYTFNGSGYITGNAFVKQGAGSLVIDNSGANNFSSVNIGGGTVQLGNNDANGSLGSSPITDSGALVFDQNVNSTFNTVVSGNGNISQIGNSIFTLNGANSGFTGTISATNGTLVVGAIGALGATTNVITISKGGTLDDNGQNLSTLANVVVSGTGMNGQGAIVNNGAAQTTAFGHITLAGNVTFGGTNRWDLRLTGGSLLTGGQPYSITKVGTNQVTIVEGGINIDQALSNIVIQSGDMGFQVLGQNQLGTNGAITVFSNATVEIDFGDTLTNTTKPIILLDGSTFFCSSSANSIDNPVVLSTNAAGGPGNITYTGGGTMTWSNVVSGPGNLNKNSAATSTLTLEANNTYTGTTTIGAGTLALGPSASIASTPVIMIASNATFNVSAVTGGFALGSSQTLGNSSSTAIIDGSVNTGSGALALTYASGTPSLVVTNGALTLSGSTRVTVDNTGAQLAAGTYAIVNSGTGGSIAGTLPSVTVTGGGAAGTASLSISGGTLDLVITAGPPPQLHFTSISISGKTLSFSAANGTASSPFTLLETTNLLLPISQWTPVFTNALDGSGSVNMSTNVVNPGIPNEYYLIEVP